MAAVSHDSLHSAPVSARGRRSLRNIVSRSRVIAPALSLSSSSSLQGSLELRACSWKRWTSIGCQRRSAGTRWAPCRAQWGSRGWETPVLKTEDLFESLVPLQSGDHAPTPDQLPDILTALSPKELADAIWSFAKQGIHPPSDVMDAVSAEVLSKLPQFRSQDLSNTIWALAVLKYQPSPIWWDAFERQVYQHVTDFSHREAANLMWSLAVLEHRPDWVLEPLLAACVDNFPDFNANALHLVGWACGKLNYCPSADWLDSFIKAAQANLFQFTPTEMSNIIWALAKLGHKLPARWLDGYLLVAQWRFPSFNAKTLSVVAWAVASLGHTPSQEWLLSYEQQVREKFNSFTGQELACIAWALRRFGYAPEHNTVYYMLQRQESFLSVDFEILSNQKLLSQVIHWKRGSTGCENSRSSGSSQQPGSSTSSEQDGGEGSS
ncbi:hypothetical protein V8C86DRAFT_2815599 [Haematococcus lacustris]